jgi:hypothetical protein
VIEPVRDRYGAEAERSHLADWLELLALVGKPLDVGELADYLKDNNWTVRSRELIYEPQEEPTEDDQDGGAGITPPEEVGDQILAVCERRLAILGTELYPFELEQRVPTLTAPQTAAHQPYLALLAITAAHHYDVECDQVPEQVFEGLVAEAMEARGLETCDLGTVGRRVNDFRETVRRAGDKIQLVANPEAAPSRTWANDEGVDTISHLSWGDMRPGHWLYIGQATVGNSGSWERKIMEPAPEQWQDFMASLMPALAYLAIPHHIEDQQIQYLTKKRRRLVLDRLRLARHLQAPAAGSPADLVIRAVAEAGVYDPRT